MSAELSNMPRLRFRLNYAKCIEGIQLLAATQPDITQYYIGKVFFFADREHLIDWGRTISGDRYVAMQHGPVPSTIYNLLVATSGEPDEIVDDLLARVKMQVNGNKVHVSSFEKNPTCPSLSNTDKEYLLSSLSIHGAMKFGEIKVKSHSDVSYEDAWSQGGLNNEMDMRLWFSDSPEMLSEIFDTAPVRRRA